ncbi:hypothetical protein K2X40_00480 [Candidatus Babeliales bacterium]|nr:hypothetical protein [Candidatus Babeliales bacterium]
MKKRTKNNLLGLMMLSFVLCIASSNLFAAGEEYQAPTEEIMPTETMPEEPVIVTEEGSSEVSY